MLAYPTVLLADADVLIDYRESELAILALVVQHVGRVAVVPSVLDEVQDVTVKGCVELGIEIVEVETERMLQAAAVEPRVSFNDRLCLVTLSAKRNRRIFEPECSRASGSRPLHPGFTHRTPSTSTSESRR